MDKNTMRYFKKFQSEEINFQRLEQAEKKAANLGEKSNDFLLIVKMVKDVLGGNFKMDKMDLAVFIGAILYILSPLDALPDLLPMVGWLDDLAVVSYMALKYSHILSAYSNYRSNTQKYLEK